MAIQNISISPKYEDEKVSLVFKNRNRRAELIYVSYNEADKHVKRPLKDFEIPGQGQQNLLLPKGFERWDKLYIRVGYKENPVPDSYLRKLQAEVRKRNPVKPEQPKVWPSVANQEQPKDTRQVTDKVNKAEKPQVKPERSKAQPSIAKPEQPKYTPQLTEKVDKVEKPQVEPSRSAELPAQDYKQKAQTALQQANQRISELERAYRSGEAVDFSDIQDPTPSQKVLLILNSIARTIRDWKNELERSRETDPNLIDALTHGECKIKEKLKTIRGEKTPGPYPLELSTDVYTDTELNKIKEECSTHIARFEGRLLGYEERSEINNVEEYDQFIPQFIKNTLFNSVSRSISAHQLPEQVKRYLQLVDYEIIPIELNKTQADARLHDIQATRQVGVEPGTIIEVILPGLRRQTDGKIIQRPLVIRGE